MDRKECEAKIAKKLDEIKEIVLKYNPSNTYLALTISDKSIMFNNDYWEDGDSVDKPIDYIKFIEEDNENEEN